MSLRLMRHGSGRRAVALPGKPIIASGDNGRSPKAGGKLPPACRSPFPLNHRRLSINPPQEHLHVR